MDVEEDKETFLIYDTQGDSKIDSTDIGDVLRALGTNPTQGDVEKIIKGITVKAFKPATYKQATLYKPASNSFFCQTPIGSLVKFPP